MISHGSPVVEQVSLVKFVMSCLAVLLVFIKLSSFPPIFILLPLSIAPDVITENPFRFNIIVCLTKKKEALKDV